MTNRQDTLDKGVIHILGGTEQTTTDSIMMLKMVHTLKLMNFLLLEFSVLIFSDLSWLEVTETMESKTTDKGRDYCIVVEDSASTVVTREERYKMLTEAFY